MWNPRFPDLFIYKPAESISTPPQLEFAPSALSCTGGPNQTSPPTPSRLADDFVALAGHDWLVEDQSHF